MNCQRTTIDYVRPWPRDHASGSRSGLQDARIPRPVMRATTSATLARIFTVALMASVGMATMPCPAAAGQAPAEFIRTLGDQALAVMRSDAPLTQKASYFHQMLHQDFDLDGMSRFVLGPYWRVASAAQRQEFRGLLEDYIVRIDGAQLVQYGGEAFRVIGSRNDPAGIIVTSQIIRPQGPPIEADWRLATSHGFYKISDLIIGGMSMVLACRTEFAAVIERDGGQVGDLLASLRWKTGHPDFGPHRVSLYRNSSDGIGSTAR